MEFKYATKNHSKLHGQDSKCSKISQLIKIKHTVYLEKDQLYTTKLVFAGMNDDDVDETGLV